MRKADYFITQEQLETIEHYKRMFEVNAERIKTLCRSEKDDIVYGFELGEMHYHLRDCFVEMTGLEDEIRKQDVKNDKKETLSISSLTSLNRNDFVIYNGGSNSKYLTKGEKYRLTRKPWSDVINVEADNGKRMRTMQRYFTID